MKRIKFLALIITLFLIIYSLTFVKIQAQNNDLIDLTNVDVSISGSDKSDIDLSFIAKEELLDLSITFTYYIGQSKETHFILSSGMASGESAVLIKYGERVENGYLYTLKLKAFAKISTFTLTFKYLVDGEEHQQFLSITNGNPNISRDIFKLKNAAIIGIIIGLFAGIGTYIAIKFSEQNAQIVEEDEEIDESSFDKEGEDLE